MLGVCIPLPRLGKYDRVQCRHCVSLLAHLHQGLEHHEPLGATAVQHTWPLPAARRRQVGDGSALTVIPAWPTPVGDTVTAGTYTVGDIAGTYTVGDTAGTYTVGDTAGMYTVGDIVPAGTYTVGDTAGTYTVGDTAGTYTAGDTAGTYTAGDTAGTYTVGDTAGTYTEQCPTRCLSTVTALGHVIEHLLHVANCLVLLSW